MSGCGEPAELFTVDLVGVKPLPAEPALDARLSDGLYRATLDTGQTFGPPLVQAKLRRLDQGAVPQVGVGHQAAQPAGASGWGDQLGVDPQASKSDQWDKAESQRKDNP
jgi:hypothetical protein